MFFAFKLAEANPRPKLLIKFLLASAITPSIDIDICAKIRAASKAALIKLKKGWVF